MPNHGSRRICVSNDSDGIYTVRLWRRRGPARAIVSIVPNDDTNLVESTPIENDAFDAAEEGKYEIEISVNDDLTTVDWSFFTIAPGTVCHVEVFASDGRRLYAREINTLNPYGTIFFERTEA